METNEDDGARFFGRLRQILHREWMRAYSDGYASNINIANKGGDGHQPLTLERT